MSKQIEALKQALDALEAHADIGIKSDKAITAIREALAEQPAQQQEPTDCDDPFAEIYDEAKKGTEAYTAPPPQRQTLPDGIPSPDELWALSDGNDGMLLNEGFPDKLDRLARWLREYAAAPAPLAEQPAQQCWKCGDMDAAGQAKCTVPWCGMREQPAQQEPVAVYVGETWCGSVVRLYEDLPLETPLYTSPQPSKPWVGLTDEEREQIRQRWATQNWMLYDIINAVDAKLKEKNA